jgi:glycerophosphoryl diester phosphodiesterase
MVDSVSDVWTGVLQRLKAAWRPLLAVNLVYAALGIVLLAPLPGIVTRLLIRLSGNTALADQDIAWFLLTPFGIASLVLVVAIIIAIAALAQASMMFIGVCPEGEPDLTRGALLFSAAKAPSVLSFCVRLVARVLLMTAPFLAVGGGAAWLLITDYDINYYLSVRPPSFWVAAVIISVLLAAMLVVVVRKVLGWSLAESERRIRGNRRLVLWVVATWALLALLLGALGLFVVQQLGTWLTPRFHEDLTILVIVLGGIMALWALLNFLSTSISGATFALAIVELTQRLGTRIDVARDSLQATGRRTRTWRLTPLRVALLLIAGTLVSVAVGAWLVDSVPMRDDIIIVAHRGAAGKAPENTLAAVRQAVEDGTDWVEIDVQETADGEVVVIHDSDFMKLAGVDLKVRDGTLQQIRSIDVGSWFDPAFSTERVPTLEEVLETTRGKARVVIELKYYGFDEQLEQRVVDIVEQTARTADVAIMSLKYDGIRKVRTLRPDWVIGLLSARAIGDLTTLDSDFLAVNTGMATSGFVRRAGSAGKQVLVWTVNDPLTVSRMMSLGIDGVITDEPEMARRVLEQRAGMNPVERLLVHAAIIFGQPVAAGVYRDSSP